MRDEEHVTGPPYHHERMFLRVLTSGVAWTGREFGSIQTAVEHLLAEARNDVVLVTYLFSGYADSTLAGIESCLRRGCNVRVVLNRFSDQPYPARRQLLTLHEKYERLRLFDFSDAAEAELHAKLLIVDRRTAIVGSANVTWRAMVVNHELAVMLDETETAESVMRAVELLLDSPQVKELRSEPL